MKIDKLLIVDNYENKNTFTDNYLLTNYMGWKIIYILEIQAVTHA